MENKKFDLEDRLVDYTCRMIDVVEALPTSKAGNYIAAQLDQVMSFSGFQLWRSTRCRICKRFHP